MYYIVQYIKYCLLLLDLNVEHAQLVLYLFHSLNLMQKKSVLLVTGSGAVRCSEAIKNPMKDLQILHLSRLLLLLEYMMKHLYDAPSTLLEQVKNFNLFTKNILLNYALCCVWGGFSMANVFYILISVHFISFHFVSFHSFIFHYSYDTANAKES